MKHILLAGDSIFDNKSYLKPDQLSVSQHLKSQMPSDKVSLLATDGAKIRDIKTQIDNIPADGTHLVISAGGNDALSHINIFNQPCGSIGYALERLCTIRDEFDEQYWELITLAHDKDIPLTLCTIYYPDFANPYPFYMKAAAGLFQAVDSVSNSPINPMNLFNKRSQMSAEICAAEAVFNDVITFRANELSIPLIDLRVMFYDEPGCYASEIEPSHYGGEIIAEKIKTIVLEHDFNKGYSEVYV